MVQTKEYYLKVLVGMSVLRFSIFLNPSSPSIEAINLLAPEFYI